MTHPKLTCSFCGRAQSEVGTLIAGPDVYICDDCVDLCSKIVSERRADEHKQAQRKGSPT